MADLGTLRPGAANTTGLPQGAASLLMSPGGSTALSDDSDSTFDNNDTNASNTRQYGRDLANMPSDFATMSTLAVRARYAWSASAPNSTWDDLAARVMGSDGTTVLAAADSGGAWQSMGNPAETTTPSLLPSGGAQSFAYVNTSANKTAWDGAILQLQWIRTRNKGGDTAGQLVYEAYITGTYTAGGGGAGIPVKFAHYRKLMGA